MNKELEFSWAQPQDLPAVEAFLEQMYGKDSVQAIPGRCQWLFFNNPFGLHVTLCRDQGKIVAFCGHLPYPVNIGGEEILAGFGVDFMVDPEYRRQGIGRRFLEMRLERFRLSLSTGQSEDMGQLYRSFGAIDLGCFYEGLYCRRPPLRGSLKSVVKGWVAWGCGVIPRPGSQRGLRFSIADQSLEKASWRTWRYQGPVYRDYVGWPSSDFSTGEPAFVLRREGNSQRVVDFCGTDFSSNEIKQLPSLTSGLSTLKVLFAGGNLKRIFSDAGFFLRPIKSSLIALSHEPSIKKRLQSTGMGILAGVSDTDLLRMGNPPEKE